MAGGFSRRMGRDKALVRYHDVPQAVWTYRLLAGVCREVWIGCRADQDLGPGNDLPRLHDRVEGRGPMESIAVALAMEPSSAWLVVACDLPRLRVEVLETLFAQRKPDCLASVFRSAVDDLPEPLCAIYEPGIRPMIDEAVAGGRRCPRKILIEAGDRIALLPPQADGALDNMNTPEEAAGFESGRQFV